MLGIDIYGESIRAVLVRRRGGSFVVQQVASAVMTESEAADPTAVAAKIKATVQENGWGHQKAVLALRQPSCFVKQVTVDGLHAHARVGSSLSRSEIDTLLQAAQSSMLVPVEQLVFDIWGAGAAAGGRATGNSGRFLLAGVEKTTVDQCVEIATHSGVKVVSIELRSLAAINGLLFSWRDVEQPNIAVAYLDRDCVHVAVMDRDAVVLLQTINFEPTDDQAPAESAWASELARSFKTMRLSGSVVAPEKLFLAAATGAQNKQLAQHADTLTAKLGLDVSVCTEVAGFQRGRQFDEKQDLWPYLPALGTALDGLSVSPVWFDFLHPQGRRVKKKRQLSWQPVVSIIVAAIILAVAFWLSLVQQSRHELRELQEKIDATRPERAQILVAKANWNLFRSFLPMREDGGPLDGSRRQYLRIFSEINSLFPDPCIAYVTELSISDQRDVAVTGVASLSSDITIRGRIQQGDVLPEFIERLNGSEMFQEAKSGGVTQDSTDSLYPFTFSASCNLVRSVGTARLTSGKPPGAARTGNGKL